MTKPKLQQLPEIQQWLDSVAPAGAELVSDSRKVKAGDVFFAYPGDAADGRAYIAQALENGASAVLYEKEKFAWDRDGDAAWRVAHRAVSGLKLLSGEIAHGYYDQADKDMLVVAVTGTNGKTSCTQWLGHALSHLGQATGVIGTLGTGIYTQGERGEFEETGNTTPDALLLQQALSNMRRQVVAALAIEASSIVLEQGRLNGMHVDVLAIGRLTFRHEPGPGPTEGEIAGHLHPAARVIGRGRAVRRRCFAGDGYRLILPAFGAYAGGLDVLDRAFGGLFAAESFRAFVLGDDRVYPVGRKALRPD